MIRVEDDFLGIHESLLVTGVKLALSDAGRTADLKVSRLSGMVPAPIADIKPVENSGSGAQ